MSVRPDVLDFMYEATRGAPEAQLTIARALDNKLIQIFGPASIVMGLTQLLGRTGGDTETVLLVGALLLYAGVVLVSIAGLWARDYRASWHASELWRYHWNDDVSETKHALMEDIAAAHEFNQVALTWKARCVCVALVLTGLEVALVVLALVWVRV